MNKIATLILICLSVAACQASRGSPVERLQGRDYQKQRDHQDCVEYGYKPQTPGYAQCRMRFQELRAQNQAAKSAAMMRAGSSLLTFPPPPAAPKVVNCNSTTWGRTTNTTCF
jgi:hypothetical protein